MYVQWHAIAVTLAELCSQINTPLVTRAWAIIDTVFDRWSMRVADIRAEFIFAPNQEAVQKSRGKAFNESWELAK